MKRSTRMTAQHLVAAAAIIGLVSGAAVAAPASAAAPAKKITTTQAQKLYSKAWKATSAWAEKTPFKYTSVITKEGKLAEQHEFAVAKNGFASSTRAGVYGDVKTIYADDSVFTTDPSGLYADFEIALAKEIGLDLTRTWSRTVIADVNLGLTLAGVVLETRMGAGPVTWPMAYPNDGRTSNTYRKAGSVETLTISRKVEGPTDPATTTVVTITGGRITSIVETTSKTRWVTTWKSFSGTVAAPTEDITNVSQIMRDPRYPKAWMLDKAQRQAGSVARMAQALAAFDSLTVPTQKMWEEAAGDRLEFVKYDRGFEMTITYELDGVTTGTFCAVYSNDSADVKAQSCGELGFTKL